MSQITKVTAQKCILFIGLVLFPHLVLGQPLSIDTIIDKKIQSMTLEEKIGQLFIVGFPNDVVSPELRQFFEKNKPGSYLLFKRNIQSLDQVRALNDQLYRLSYKVTKLPPLVAIDQEGGSVSRLPIVPAPPNALSIGQTSSVEISKEMGLRTGHFLREVGINMNLAPVLDLADPNQVSFIGSRAFGSDPDIVSKLGTAFASGLIDAHVIPTAKHFPGSGGSALDPHYTVVSSSKSAQELKSKDMKPFVDYAKLGSKSAVMMSHLIYPHLDPSLEPASFSKIIKDDLLRKELGYTGLIMTDDLQMQGSKKLLGPEAAALKALQSGADLVMLTWSFVDQEKAMQAVRTAFKKGEFPEADVHAKLKRILIAKAFANAYRRNPLQPNLVFEQRLSSKEYEKLEGRILSTNLSEQLKSKSEDERGPASDTSTICAMSPSQNFIGQLQAESNLKIKTSLFKPRTAQKGFLNWLKTEKCELVVFSVTGKQSANFVRLLPKELKQKLVVVNLAAPFLVPTSSPHLKVLQLYFNHQDAGKSIARILPDLLQPPSLPE